MSEKLGYLMFLFGERALRSSVTALTAALTTGGASGAALTTPVRRRWRRLRPCSKTCGTETGCRTLPAGRSRRWLLDGRGRDGPAAALGAIGRQPLLAQGNNTNRRSSWPSEASRS